MLVTHISKEPRNLQIFKILYLLFANSPIKHNHYANNEANSHNTAVKGTNSANTPVVVKYVLFSLHLLHENVPVRDIPIPFPKHKSGGRLEMIGDVGRGCVVRNSRCLYIGLSVLLSGLLENQSIGNNNNPLGQSTDRGNASSRNLRITYFIF